MKKRTIKNIKTAAKVVYYGVFAALALWVCASWADVVADNTQPNPHHAEWNVFVMLTENEG